MTSIHVTCQKRYHELHSTFDLTSYLRQELHLPSTFTMDAEQHTLSTPPTKRRKVMSVNPSPRRLSDLMASFGARSTPDSVSKANRQSAGGHGMRQTSAVNYAESQSSAESSPKSVSSFGEKQESSTTSLTGGNSKEETEDEQMAGDSEDELHSSDVIEVQPRRTSTRQLPARSTRKQVSYARPVKKATKKVISKRKTNKLLLSDTNRPKSKSKPIADTARGRIRQDIFEVTKPKRDAFILANKDYFTPILPETANYIDKLERIHAMTDVTGEGSQPEIVKYKRLTQQPLEVKAVMKPYQLDGLSFLVYMYNNGMSAILGDEMGLGKVGLASL